MYIRSTKIYFYIYDIFTEQSLLQQRIVAKIQKNISFCSHGKRNIKFEENLMIRILCYFVINYNTIIKRNKMA